MHSKNLSKMHLSSFVWNKQKSFCALIFYAMGKKRCVYLEKMKFKNFLRVVCFTGRQIPKINYSNRGLLFWDLIVWYLLLFFSNRRFDLLLQHRIHWSVAQIFATPNTNSLRSNSQSYRSKSRLFSSAQSSSDAGDQGCQSLLTTADNGHIISSSGMVTMQLFLSCHSLYFRLVLSSS